MRRLAKILIVLLVLAVLPLRGYAGAVMALCEAHHGGASAAHEHAHAHGDTHDHGTRDGGAENTSHTASVCSLCTSCCVSASLAPDSAHSIAFVHSGVGRISFVDRRFSGFVPDNPDRPPLPLSR